MSVASNKTLRRLVDAKDVLTERAAYLNHKYRDIVHLARTTPGKESKLLYVRQASRILQLASTTLQHAMILDGLIDSIVNVRILSDYNVTTTLTRLCNATIADAMDQVKVNYTSALASKIQGTIFYMCFIYAWIGTLCIRQGHGHK